MRYSKLVEVYEALEATTKKLAKRDILAKFYASCPAEFLYKAVHLSMGVVPTAAELGIASEMMVRIIMSAYGVGKNEVIKKYKEVGDLGSVAEWFASNRKQMRLARHDLSVDEVFDNLAKLPEITGPGSQERKIGLVVQLLSHAKPIESRYIVRTVLGEMRIGVAHGTVRDAIAIAFNRDPSDIERAWNVSGDFGRIAEMAKAGRLRFEIALFTPVRVMLAERAPDLKTALEEFEHPAIETKLDGFRAQIHKRGNEIKIFSRRLEDVTKQFPEVVEWAKACLEARECIVEGEILAVDPKTREPRPFQQLSRRIQRKYAIEKMVREIPVRMSLFECIWVDGENLMHKPLSERWETLQKIVKPMKGKFDLIDHIETKDFEKANAFYQKALSIGEEGVLVKNLDAHYQPGRRVGYWLKVKPIMEPLDLVIIGGTWGLGKRAKWIGSILLGARKGKTFLATGMMGSGLTDEQFEELTKRLKKLIIEEKGRELKFKPEIVVEVGYEEIQRSPKYPTGFALRFPKLLRFRDDKKPSDANTVSDIQKLFVQQKRFKKSS